MSVEPKLPRWTEPGSEAPDQLQELLRAGRAPLGSSQEVAQLSQGLAQLLGPAAGLSATSLAAPAAAGWALGRWAAWAAAGVSSAAALWYFTAEPAAPPPPSLLPPAPHSQPAPTPVLLPPEPPPPPRLQAPTLEAPAPPPPVAEAPRAPRAPRASAGSGEVELLRRAQSVLAASPERALALTAEHQRRFGAGALAEEREALAIEALRRLGRTSAAQRRAAAFTKRYPNSVHASRVRGSVAPPSER